MIRTASPQNSPANRVALIILDGFGLSAAESGNAVLAAKLPFLNSLVQRFPAVPLAASGTEVGLAWGEVGNSEVGHFNIGAGRVVLQDLPRINASIESGRFFENLALVDALARLKERRGRLHLVGLLSNGGVHGHIDHLLPLLKLAKQQGVASVVIHGITDGRDTQPKVAGTFLRQLEEATSAVGIGRLGTLVGRFYALDRDNRWERVRRAFEAFVDRRGTPFTDPEVALKAAYAAGQADETLEPLVNQSVAGIADRDLVIMTNYRVDRARQLAQALSDPAFSRFRRSSALKELEFVSFVSYGGRPSPRTHVAYFAEPVRNFLADELAQAKRHQLHVAETEKYAHVTYFLNAGQEAPCAGEERVLVPSPKVANYDSRPDMSAPVVAKQFARRFSPPFDLGVVNFANPDMVGHTGNLTATVQALETIDGLLKPLVTDLLDKGVAVLLTADHGNCEQMVHPNTGEIDKEHTVNPVPFILARAGGERASDADLRSLAGRAPVGVLADVAPTALELLGLPVPTDMTGQSLLHGI